jgi:hypothetical protein
LLQYTSATQEKQNSSNTDRYIKIQILSSTIKN